MPAHTINTDILHADHVADYFLHADRRILSGYRMALELLGLYVPDYAIRRPSGRTPAREVAAAYAGDNPAPRFLKTSAKPAYPRPHPITPVTAEVPGLHTLGTSRPDLPVPTSNLFADVFGPASTPA